MSIQRKHNERRSSDCWTSLEDGRSKSDSKLQNTTCFVEWERQNMRVPSALVAKAPSRTSVDIRGKEKKWESKENARARAAFITDTVQFSSQFLPVRRGWMRDTRCPYPPLDSRSTVDAFPVYTPADLIYPVPSATSRCPRGMPPRILYSKQREALAVTALDHTHSWTVAVRGATSAPDQDIVGGEWVTEGGGVYLAKRLSLARRPNRQRRRTFLGLVVGGEKGEAAGFRGKSGVSGACQVG
ncbi:hypothetical protein R3P38DRAFT_2766495 [Favolaschia claudopus]|uniref:Uncharacterized protein n=1 Tax=Favolaschia claudopus TaxID=2862362 RepID=A0AAW0D2V1_9AGAR